ncbi:DNA adenine methylase [Acinetobacter sp.]|uniref:DNA adenine methylase n=1 Tax=Acinetobacter sp. TaxID=472 RepID=UPI002606440A|nr:DNA adenine methylase [uncultured Acinetobacter sp.]
MAKIHSALRYPGGKAKFAPFVKKLIQENNLYGDYFEPYAGGAGVALELLFSGHCKRIHINDYDIAIYNFWKSIVDDTENFLRLLCDVDVTIEEWYRQKDVLNNPLLYSPLEHGFATFFLNRTNRSGILKGGVIGGKLQNGSYRLDARFNKINLMNRIEKIGCFSGKIHVYNENTVSLLDRIDSLLPKGSLIYLDPPYYRKGQDLYRNYYQHQDHVDIKEKLDSVSTPWIVSYDNCSEIKKIYKGCYGLEYQLNYSAYNKVKGSEIMFFSKNIIPTAI